MGGFTRTFFRGAVKKMRGDVLCEGGKGWNGEKDLVNDGVPYDDFEGIGVELAAKIAYQTLTAYCVPNTDYCAVRAYWLDAALDVIEAAKGLVVRLLSPRVVEGS